MNDLETQVTAPLINALHEGVLLAYGRLGNIRAEPRLITKDIWPSLTVLRFDISAVGESRPGGEAFLAVRVFQSRSGHCPQKAQPEKTGPKAALPSTVGKAKRRQKPTQEALLIDEFLRSLDPSDPVLSSPKKTAALFLERHPAFAKTFAEQDSLRTRMSRAIKNVLKDK